MEVMTDHVTVSKGQDWIPQIREENKRTFEHGI